MHKIQKGEWKAEFLSPTGLAFSKTFRTKLEAKNYERYLESTFGSLVIREKDLKRPVDFKPFTINGCKIQPAKVGMRCQGLRLGCKMYDSCLDAVSRRAWTGWRVAKEEGFTYLKKKGGEEE